MLMRTGWRNPAGSPRPGRIVAGAPMKSGGLFAGGAMITNGLGCYGDHKSS